MGPGTRRSTAVVIPAGRNARQSPPRLRGALDLRRAVHPIGGIWWSGGRTVAVTAFEADGTLDSRDRRWSDNRCAPPPGDPGRPAR